MKKNSPQWLEQFLSHFPTIQPPITLSGEIAYKFSAENKPLSPELLGKTLGLWEQYEDHTEFVPCFQLQHSDQMLAIVYWKASLLSYEYKLATLDLQGNLVATKVIAGVVSNGATVNESVASIDEDLCVVSVQGVASDASTYDPQDSSAIVFEILPDGQIVSSKENPHGVRTNQN